MDPITAIANLAGTIFSRLVGDKDKALQQQFILELTKELNTKDLALGQIGVNKAEADNPNRKWMTWREMAGYLIVFALAWQWILAPMVSFVSVAVGHPIDMSKVLAVDVVDILYIMMGMLGLDLSPQMIARFGKKKV